MRKGFTLIELLAVIVILAIIALIATPLIINVIDESKKGAFKNTAYGIIEAGELEFTQDILDGTEEEVTFTYTNGVESSSPSGRTLEYKGAKPQNGTIVVNTEGKVAIAIHDGTYCAEKGFDESEVTLSDKIESECIISGITPTYAGYNETKGVNVPKLVTGMTPIKWNGTSWEDTTIDDSDWYDYSAKKWANARTEDGSFWVWIPRYAYQISSCYHTSQFECNTLTSEDSGDINIKFLMDDTNTTNDSAIIEDTPTYSGNVQTNYVVHPAFTFGSDELPGIWIAKFEASVADQTDACYISEDSTNCDKTTLVPKMIPNATSWRYITIGNAFDVSLDMKNNSTYGFDAGEVDTHLTKNTEWGAVSYLSNSIYGKDAEVWINPANTFTTGCAGDSAISTATTGCTSTYETSNGQQASTTGNIYGVYDMSGGSWERTAAYLDNGNANLTTNGSSIISADEKYKNVYNVGTTDGREDNYLVANSVFGDGVYETSGYYSGPTSWYRAYSYMIFGSSPWFNRGCFFNTGESSGILGFDATSGSAYVYGAFRPVIAPIN